MRLPSSIQTSSSISVFHTTDLHVPQPPKKDQFFVAEANSDISDEEEGESWSSPSDMRRGRRLRDERYPY